jgi:hypothetical protein
MARRPPQTGSFQGDIETNTSMPNLHIGARHKALIVGLHPANPGGNLRRTGHDKARSGVPVHRDARGLQL